MLAQQRYLQINIPALDAQLYAIEFSGKEEINKLFSFDLKVLAQAGLVDQRSFLGQSVDISLGQDHTPRHFNGLVCCAEKTTLNDRGYQVFNLTIVPWLYFLDLGTDCRIFQNQSVVDIFKTICREYGYNHYYTRHLDGDYPPIDYCTQYNESDKTFIERLFQQAGISYTFTYQAGKHTLVLFDQPFTQPHCCEEIVYNTQQKGSSAITAWEPHTQWHTSQDTRRDYHGASIPTTLEATNAPRERFSVSHVDTFEHFSYPGLFTTPSEGEALAKRYMAQQHTRSHYIDGQSNEISFIPGSNFTLSQHPQVDQQGQYFLTQVKHQAHDYSSLPFAHEPPKDKATQYYHNDFTCIADIRRYAPECTHPCPVIIGPQTATVVGVSERDAYPEDTEQVKVQFHWDRLGDNTPQSSCWIRVGHHYAGPHHGMQFIPREGSEVLIDFMDGNPDRPEIAGMLPNGRNKLPFDPIAQPNISGIKTRSGGLLEPDEGHELSFDDSKGREQITLHSHNALNISSKGDEHSTVGSNLTHTVEGNHTIASHDTLVINARQNITLKAGKNTITLSPNQVRIESPLVRSTASGPTVALPDRVPVFTPLKPINAEAQEEPQLQKDKNNSSNSKHKFEYYIVNYDGFKQPLAKGLLSDIIEVFTDVNILDGFEDERWIEVRGNTKVFSKEEMQVNEYSKGELDRNTRISAGVAGAMSGMSIAVYNESLKHQLIKKLERVMLKIKKIPKNDGILIEAQYWYFDEGIYPTANLRNIRIVAKGADYKPLIKKALTGPLLEATPPKSATTKYLFIWVEENNNGAK